MKKDYSWVVGLLILAIAILASSCSHKPFLVGEKHQMRLKSGPYFTYKARKAAEKKAKQSNQLITIKTTQQ